MTIRPVPAGSMMVSTNWLRLDPATRPSYSPTYVASLATSIVRSGILTPIVIDQHRTILSGQGLWLAAKHLRLSEVPVTRLDRQRLRRSKH